MAENYPDSPFANAKGLRHGCRAISSSHQIGHLTFSRTQAAQRDAGDADLNLIHAGIKSLTVMRLYQYADKHCYRAKRRKGHTERRNTGHKNRARNDTCHAGKNEVPSVLAMKAEEDGKRALHQNTGHWRPEGSINRHPIIGHNPLSRDHQHDYGGRPEKTIDGSAFTTHTDPKHNEPRHPKPNDRHRRNGTQQGQGHQSHPSQGTAVNAHNAPLTQRMLGKKSPTGLLCLVLFGFYTYLNYQTSECLAVLLPLTGKKVPNIRRAPSAPKKPQPGPAGKDPSAPACPGLCIKRERLRKARRIS